MSIERRTLSGEVLAAWSTSVSVYRGSTAAVRGLVDVATTTDPATEYLLVTAGEPAHDLVLRRGQGPGLPCADWDVEASADGPVTRVTVTTRTLVRDLALFADRLDPAAGVDDMLVTLLPGSRTRSRSPG